MQFIYLVRNAIQWFLIRLIKMIKPLTRSKIFLFSEFMANRDRRLLLTRKGAEYFVVQTADVAVSRKLYIGASDEHVKVIRALEIMEKARGRHKLHAIVDIGANLGHICIPIVRQGYAASAIAFEPEPGNHRLCLANILINDLADRIVLHRSALGTREGESLTFELSEDNFGDHRVRVSASDGIYSERSRQVISVPSTTLDSFFPTPPSPLDTLLWIDVQGYEGQVLEGAQQILARKVPIGVEFWPYGQARAGSFDSFMKSLSRYDAYYDLNSNQPTPRPIQELRKLYEERKTTQYWTDILVF